MRQDHNQNSIDYYIANCLDRILLADCAQSELRRRTVAISEAIRIAHRDGIEAAHKHLQGVLAEAEAGGFAQAESAGKTTSET